MNSNPEVTWSRHFSIKRDRYYYVDSTTKISQWDSQSDLSDKEPSKVFTRSFSRQDIIDGGSTEICRQSAKSTLANLSQLYLPSTSSSAADLLAASLDPVINYNVTEACKIIRKPAVAPNSMLKVRIIYKNSPTDSRIVAQSWEENMTFSDLLNKALSKLRLPSYSDNFDVQLSNYDHTEEPIVVSMGELLSNAFEICDKTPTLEFLLREESSSSIYRDNTSYNATTVGSDRMEQLPTNIAPQLFDKDQVITNDDLWNEENAVDTFYGNIKVGQEKEQPQQSQIQKEQLPTKINQKKNIASSKHGYLNPKKVEVTETAANFSSILSHQPHSGKEIATQLKRERISDDIEEEKMEKKSDFFSYPKQREEEERPLQCPRRGENTKDRKIHLDIKNKKIDKGSRNLKGGDNAEMKNTVSKALCARNLACGLSIKGPRDAIIRCYFKFDEKNPCRFTHKKLRETTRTEAMESVIKMKDAQLKRNLEAEIAKCIYFK